MKRTTLIPLGAALLLAGLLAAVLLWKPTPRPQTGLDARPEGGDFSLGEFSLNQLRGTVVLLYFGYTGCPDICPTSLADMALALKGLTPEELTRVRGLFVSVDPQRDTPETLSRYAGYFHANILGRTGTKAEIDRAVKLYGASYRMVDHGSAGGYQVDHSAFIYVIDPQGKLRASLPYAVPAETIVEEVRKLLGS